MCDCGGHALNHMTETIAVSNADIADEGLDAVESQKNFLLQHGFIDADFDIRAWAAPELDDA